jgi:hypothetical protein
MREPSIAQIVWLSETFNTQLCIRVVGIPIWIVGNFGHEVGSKFFGCDNAKFPNKSVCRFLYGNFPFANDSTKHDDR